MLDPANPVVALCSAGMAHEGPPAERLDFFVRAWAAARDDYDACIAAHYLAISQAEPSEALRWHSIAVSRAEAVTDERAAPLFASLYLNLGDAEFQNGELDQARAHAALASRALDAVPASGYRTLVEGGIARLLGRLA